MAPTDSRPPFDDAARRARVRRTVVVVALVAVAVYVGFLLMAGLGR